MLPWIPQEWSCESYSTRYTGVGFFSQASMLALSKLNALAKSIRDAGGEKKRVRKRLSGSISMQRNRMSKLNRLKEQLSAVNARIREEESKLRESERKKE